VGEAHFDLWAPKKSRRPTARVERTIIQFRTFCIITVESSWMPKFPNLSVTDTIKFATNTYSIELVDSFFDGDKLSDLSDITVLRFLN
jgi:hypothetical protein